MTDSGGGRTRDVLIADDHPLIRAGIKATLAGRPEWRVCAETETGEAAIRLAQELKPDLIVVDYALPIANGVEVARQLCQDMPGIGVLVYTMHVDERVLMAAIRAGARGYVLKSEDDATLLAAMREVATGGTYISEGISSRQPARLTDATISALTVRETEVIRLVAMGETNKGIAAKLNVSIKTVDTHRTAAMRKLDLHSAIDVALFAIRSGMINP
ncbi:response regulator transcription factor [Rhizobium sp. LjRoot30]|uniref:response regulator n=1 Tax=Rhizobium sp. LjRoot30 TaxID=3342320 RepID=UPI003ECE92C1